MCRLAVSRTAHGQIRKLPAPALERVDTAIVRLAVEPRPPGVKKLAAREGYRIRVGDYRILYPVDDAAKLVVIYRVKPRRSAYHDL